MIVDNVEPPQRWDEFPQGDLMKSLLEQNLETWWSKTFGYHLLKIGALSAELRSDECSIKHQVRVMEYGSNAGVLAKPEALPFQENSVDAVLLANCLEYSENPHQIIREAHRVLIPEGYLIICGFNPVSMFGLRHNNPLALDKSIWQANLYRSSRVVDWLTVLGARVVETQRVFIRPTTEQSNNNVKKVWRKYSERYLPRMAGMYILIAQKQEMPMTLAKSSWNMKPRFATAKVPTFKQAGEMPAAKISSDAS